MNGMIGIEYYGSNSVKKRYFRTADGAIEAQYQPQKFASLKQFFMAVFLPQGYPDSVSDDYLTYQIWDTVQAFCSSITNSLATQAVLKGVGVGDKEASVLSATFTWIIKDGTGMLGRILFAWTKGSYLDCDCKRWRLFADILNDIAIFLEISAAFFPDYFRLIICIASVSKSIVGVAGGATRAALTQHQSRRNNMADVSAKDGSQETLVNLAALFCNLVLLPFVTQNQSLTWLLFLVFTGLHLFSNYRAVSSVKMELFNLARLHIVVQDKLKHPTTQHLLDVSTTNAREPVLIKLKRHYKVNLGCSLQDLITRQVSLPFLLDLFSKSNYLLSVNLHKDAINVSFNENSTYRDQLEAAYQVEVIEFCCVNSAPSSSPLLSSIKTALRSGDEQLVIKLSHQFVIESFSSFVKQAEFSGWKCSPVLLYVDEWRNNINSETVVDKSL